MSLTSLSNSTLRAVQATTTSVPWTRPADWVTMPTVLTSDEKFVGLHAVTPTNCFVALSATGNYTVDWGDGLIENFATGVIAYHTYNYATFDVGNATLTSQGFKQAIVVVTPQSGQQLNSLNLHIRHTSASTTYYSSGFYQIAVSGQYLGTMLVSVPTPGISTQSIYFYDLRIVNIVRSNLKNIAYMFYYTGVAVVLGLNLCPTPVATIAFTSTDVGDLLTSAGHGFANGDPTSLGSIYTTTGLYSGTLYYVINATTDTFQVSTTPGGSAAVLTLDGNGTFMQGCSTAYAFNYATNLQSFQVSNLDTVICSAFMFQFCYSLVELSSLNMEGAWDIQSMFAYTSSLATVGTFRAPIALYCDRLFDSCRALQKAPKLILPSILYGRYMFNNCYALTGEMDFTNVPVRYANYMFYSCKNMEKLPVMKWSILLDCSYMFNLCINLKSIPSLTLTTAQLMPYMFSGCNSLKSVGKLSLPVCTSLSNTFYLNPSLVDVDSIYCPVIATTDNIFYSCNSLVKAPFITTGTATNTSYMFTNCFSLTTVPLYDLSATLTVQSMFSGCNSLCSLPSMNTAVCTNFTTMFSACYSLLYGPALDTSSATIMTSMFSTCVSLVSVPLYNTSLVTSFTQMFYQCYALQTVPQFNTVSVTAMDNMFYFCGALQSVPTFNVPACLTMFHMFDNCRALISVGGFTNCIATTIGYLFYNCVSLRVVPLFNTSAVTIMDAAFEYCYSLQSIPAYDVTAVTSFSNAFYMAGSLTSFNITGSIKASLDVTNKKLDSSSLQNVLNRTGTGIPTIYITGNPGTGSIISLAGTGAPGDTSILMASTAGITVGMFPTSSGTGVGIGGAHTFTTGTNLCTTAYVHGLVNGDEVAFGSIVTTTGVIINTIYYVINSTSTTFQVSLTPGGAAIAFALSGSGRFKYRCSITAINPNVSVTLSRPVCSTVTTLTCRSLNTQGALLRGSSVTG